jgi:type VI protein secretion system component VasF
MPRRTTITVPAAVHDLILPSLEKKMKHGEAHHQSNFVAFAIFVGIVVLFVVPYIVWKWTGQRRATALVKQWQAEDARSRPPEAFVPVWTVNLYGNLSSSVVR